MFHPDHCGPTSIKGYHRLVHKDQLDFKAFRDRIECDPHSNPDWIALALNADRLIIGIITARASSDASVLGLLEVKTMPRNKECPISVLIPLLQTLEDQVEPYMVTVSTTHLSSNLRHLLEKHCHWVHHPSTHTLVKTLVHPLFRPPPGPPPL